MKAKHEAARVRAFNRRSDLPNINVDLRMVDTTGKRLIEGYQVCGGGRRVIRKKIGAS